MRLSYSTLGLKTRERSVNIPSPFAAPTAHPLNTLWPLRTTLSWRIACVIRMRRISAPSGFTGNLLLKPTILLPLASVSRTQNWLITRPPTPRKRNPAPLPRGKTTSLDVTHLILFTANLGEFLARRIEDEFGHVQQLI